MEGGIWGEMGCGGLLYVANLALRSRRRADNEQELVWDVLPPLMAYVLVIVSAASWALEASVADEFAAAAAVALLVTALRNSWIVTLGIGARRR